MYKYRNFLILIIGAILSVVASIASYASSNIEGMAIEKMPSEELLARSNRYIHETQQPDSALVYLKVLGSRAHKSSLSVEEADLISRGLTMLGGLYINEYHDYARAAMAFLGAQSVAREHNCLIRLAESEVALATLNLASLNYEDINKNSIKELVEESMKRYENAFEIASEAGSGKLMGFAAVNLGLLSFDTQNLKEKTVTLKKAVADSRIPEWQRLLCRSFLLWSEGNYDEALQIITQSNASLNTTGKEARYRLQNDKIRINMLLALGRRAEARNEGERMAAEAKADNDPITAYEVYRSLWNDAQSEGDLPLAQNYELEMLRARVSAQHTDIPDAIAEGKMQYEIENLEESLIADSRRISSLHQTLWLVGGFMLVLLGLLVALFVKHRQLKESHRLIVKRDKELFSEPVHLAQISKINTEDTESVTSGTLNKENMPSESDKSYQLFCKVDELLRHDEAVFDEDFSAVALAAKLHERQSNVSNAIQLHTGGSFNTLLAEVRVKEACRRILDKENYGNYTVEAIAFSVGYKSRSHFTSVFKKITGMSPSDYMRQARLS